jgi:hypothetical protein
MRVEGPSPDISPAEQRLCRNKLEWMKNFRIFRSTTGDSLLTALFYPDYGGFSLARA